MAYSLLKQEDGVSGGKDPLDAHYEQLKTKMGMYKYGRTSIIRPSIIRPSIIRNLGYPAWQFSLKMGVSTAVTMDTGMFIFYACACRRPNALLFIN